MAHDLSIQNGKVEMAYSGDTPWHSLGTRVDGLQTPQDMVRVAIPFTVGLREVYQQVDGQPSLIQGHRAIVREDTNVVLGMASKNYKPVQNLQVAEIMDAIVSEGNATVEVCGALGNGGECWMLSRIPDTFEVTRGDQINNYVLLAWGHDGKHGIAGKVTPTRVVCRNTLRAAGFGKGKWSTSADLYLKHYGDMRVRIAEARDALGLIHKQVETTQEAYKALAAHQVTTEEVRAYFKTLFPEPVKPETPTSAYKEQVNHWLDRYSELISAYESAPGATPGTAWGAYNAVTYYTDHRYPILSNGQWSQSRVQTVAAGSMATVKDKALTEALALL